ncbi:alpha-1 4-glucan-protein synthase [Halobacteriales archaeon SW_10_68_16]|nr:MAG: alpha-1 4-glucan-protein synthase [Halobacteriales archaeon SW_10_68_16]
MTTKRGDVCLIVPTIREYECLRSYVANAREHGFDTDRLHAVLVTEDFCDTDAMERMLDDLGGTGEGFDGTRRERWLDRQGAGEYAHLVPEASHAQTSFGVLYLWANDFEYGVFVDDDTLPHPEFDFFGRHLRNLQYEGPVESVRSDERWVNVLYQKAGGHGLYPRGYPYSAMDETVETSSVRVAAAEDFSRQFVASEGQYLTVCSMNLAFRREVVPAFYQLPMDDNPWDVGRFDDIWSGVFLKRACDVLGKGILNGYPLCEHNKAARSTFSDLTNEVHGLELNEHVWEIVDDVGGDAATYAGVFEAMGRELAAGDFGDYENGAFLNYVGEHMLEWLDCLEALSATDRARAGVTGLGDD